MDENPGILDKCVAEQVKNPAIFNTIQMTDNLLFFGTIFGGSAMVALLNAQLSIRLSLRAGWVDSPNQRSLHCAPTPRLGGLGIVLAFYLVMMIIIAVYGFDLLPRLSRGFNVVMLAGALLLSMIGFYDDIKTLKSGMKFVFQLLATVIVVTAGKLSSLHLFTPLMSALLFSIVIFWVVAFCNVYNFMDGINGLSGSTGIIYGISLALLALERSEVNIAIMSMIVGGCCLGFLFLNFPQARTFMGDGGSLFLGFVFALIIVKLIFLGASPIVLGLVVSVYVFDSGFTIIRRFLRRENIFAAHRSHLYQRLVLAGVDQKYVTLLYASLQVCTSLLAFHYEITSVAGKILTLASISFIFLVFTLFVSRAEHLKASEL